MQSTEWRPVVGYEGKYEVSEQGQVRSLDRYARAGQHPSRLYPGRVLRLVPAVGGRVTVSLHLAGVQRTRLVHHLVLDAFVGLRPEGTEACHWDGDPTNNSLSNLRWDTHVENERDKVRHGTHNNTVKTHCPRGHALAEPNLVPGDWARGYRKCRACNIAAASAFKRGVPFTQEDADTRYAGVMAGITGLTQEACKRGHLLVAPNLVAAALKTGRRGCRACQKASSYARYRGIPFDEAVARECYETIMES